MPPSDQEPRYQLVDSNGNVVGSLFGDGSGNVVIADETDTQTTFDSNGITTPALEAGDIDTDRTWQDVSASRSFNTTEKNGTNSEIIVAITVNVDAGGFIDLIGEIDSSVIVRSKSTLDAGDQEFIQFIVSTGSDYKLGSTSGDFSIVEWREFRP